MNYRFDIDDWLPRFPLQPSYERYSGEIITSPCHLCNNAHLRVAAGDQFDWGPAVPVDIFVMSEGEPSNRHVTKMGGLPYRSASLPWPTADNGELMTFLGQFDFTDSEDIVGELPGEVLLIFSNSNKNDDLSESLYFEWNKLGLEDLISREELPRSKRQFDPCYGNLCRTVSFPDARQKLRSGNLCCEGLELKRPWLLPQYQATQIGSGPYFIQQHEKDAPGQLLCTLNSVRPEMHNRYPWVNHEAPLVPEKEWRSEDIWRIEDRYLMFGDVGCIHIAIGEDGQLSSRPSSY